MADNQEPITLELPTPSAITPTTPSRQRWVEENKSRVMDWLTFKGKEWEDVAFAAVIYVCAPMFAVSILLNLVGSIPALLIIFITLVAVVGCIAIWLIKNVPESSALVWGRLVLITIGLILGGLL